MTAKRLSILLLFAATIASAQMNRHRGATPAFPGMTDAATVSGTVSAVSGNIIALANGTVTLDASGAKIIDNAGAAISASSITTGSLVVATVKPDNIAANAPIPATLIAVSKPAALTLSGPVTSVDAAHNSFVLLGRTIQVTPQTSFGGPFLGMTVRGLADVQPNEYVVVQANPGGTQTIVATSVMVMAIHVDAPDFIHGTVKSIATDAWVITDDGKDTTVTVNAQTHIVGNPKVGDTVDVLTVTDSSGKVVAISIMKSMLPIFQPPFH